MSHILETEFGRFRRIARTDGKTTLPLDESWLSWLFECPGCKLWAYLDDGQFNGRVSVDHSAQGCKGGYHETHDFAAALSKAAAALTPQEDSDEP